MNIYLMTEMLLTKIRTVMLYKDVAMREMNKRENAIFQERSDRKLHSLFKAPKKLCSYSEFALIRSKKQIIKWLGL